jgi:CDP-diacylglycerol--glycerol-3-phosphate 3-phosphatidyltransferase
VTYFENAVESMTRKRSHSILNLPNSLTFFRIACIPILVVLLFFPHKSTSFLAALVFGLASISDLLDGFLARRRQMVTTFGKFLDPLADKLVVSAALIMLIPLGRVYAWMVVVIIGRELAVTGLRSVAVFEGKVISASELGKKKMVLQIVAVLGLLLHYASPSGQGSFTFAVSGTYCKRRKAEIRRGSERQAPLWTTNRNCIHEENDAATR